MLLEYGKDATFNFSVEKKHDIGMLIKKGFVPSIIGRTGDVSGTMFVVCEDMELPAVEVQK